ncbi:PLP-dependent transferase [Klebsiella variicola subsp. variicola]|nr:PLP-dependent transferase [Klebsiella variicola subsp. variicola]
MEVHDVPAIVAAVRQVAPEAIIMIDNTWAAGILFKALDLASIFLFRQAPNT